MIKSIYKYVSCINLLLALGENSTCAGSKMLSLAFYKKHL